MTAESLPVLVEEPLPPVEFMGYASKDHIPSVGDRLPEFPDHLVVGARYELVGLDVYQVTVEAVYQPEVNP